MSSITPETVRERIFKKLNYKPHSEAQWEIHNSTARFRTVCCGRRWGKSTWAGHEITVKMFVPDSINWIVGPNYSLGEKEFRVVRNDFERLGILSRCRVQFNINQGNMRIHFPDLNSVCEVKSAEKQDGLVGEKLSHVCMSEAAKHKMSTWQMYVQPALADTRGTADFPSTPEGYNWYEAMYQLGQNPDAQLADYASWRMPSWTNPHVYPGGRTDPEILRLERDVSKEWFAQEIAAEFTTFEGMIYPEFQDSIHVRRCKFNPALPNYIALDFGYTDPFVALDIQVDVTGRVYVWREYQVTHKSTTDHGFVLMNRENPPGYAINSIYADPRGADQIATLRSMFYGGIQANVVGWDMGIEAVKRAMKVREDGLPGLIIDPSCGMLIRQLRGLRKKMIREGHNERPGQHDYDDHGPDALRYFFNEHVVLGGGIGLSDVYDIPYKGSEAESFFNMSTMGAMAGRDLGF